MLVASLQYAAFLWKPAPGNQLGTYCRIGKVYPEGSRNAGLRSSTHDHLRDWDIGIVRFLNVNSISNFHNSGCKCTCYNLLATWHIQRLSTYCRMCWKKLSGVTRSRRKNAWTSCLSIGWYLATALRWKYSWNDFLCLRHHRPYGIMIMAIPRPILHWTVFLISSLRWKECGTYSSFNIIICFLSE